MKLCAFISQGEERAGLLTDRGVVDLSELGFGRLQDIIEGGPIRLFDIIIAAGGSRQSATNPAEITYTRITRPKKIICAGLNYADHAAETGGEIPKNPVFFTKFADTLAPHGAQIELPEYLRCYDYEAELVAVIGKSAFNVEEDHIDDYIFGYTCGSDLSARDAQLLSSQWAAGKNLPGFAPAGPIIVTADEWQPENKFIRCYVNGERVQDGNTDDMIFSPARFIAAATKYFALGPGDLVFTGTPAGVILGKPKGARTWLKPGDRIETEIEGIGTLSVGLVSSFC